MAFPRIDEPTMAFFDSLVPDNPRVLVRPMFGNVAAFVNGNMFPGALGQDVLVRLPEEGRAELLAEEGAAVPEPYAGPANERVRDAPGRVARAQREGPRLGPALAGRGRAASREEAEEVQEKS